MEIGVAELILKNGLSMVVLAFIVMCLVGFVKIFTKGLVTEKPASEKKKAWLSKLYLLLSLVFSYVVVLAYYALLLKENCWSLAAVRDAGIVWTVTSPLYQIYKQFGGRKLLVTIATAIQKALKGKKNKNAEDLLNLIIKVLESDAPLLTDAQKEAIKADLAIQLSGKKEKAEEPKAE